MIAMFKEFINKPCNLYISSQLHIYSTRSLHTVACGGRSSR